MGFSCVVFVNTKGPKIWYTGILVYRYTGYLVLQKKGVSKGRPFLWGGIRLFLDELAGADAVLADNAEHIDTGSEGFGVDAVLVAIVADDGTTGHIDNVNVADGFVAIDVETVADGVGINLEGNVGNIVDADVATIARSGNVKDVIDI